MCFIPVKVEAAKNMEDSTSTPKAQWTSAKKLCPVLWEPLRECYCHDMTSQKIAAAIYYCGGKFEECIIYQRIKATRHRLLI